MKKVLSVAMASAMVLGMGANAFAAIQYSTGSNDKADWPENFQFEGQLFVTNKDGDVITDATTALNDSEAVDFQPGDTIWMPLYADDQLVYDALYNRGEAGKDAINNIEVSVTEATKETAKFYWSPKAPSSWYTDATCTVAAQIPAGYAQLETGTVAGYYAWGKTTPASVVIPKTVQVGTETTERPVVSARVVVDGKVYTAKASGIDALNTQLANLFAEKKDNLFANGYSIKATVNVDEIEGSKDSVDKPVVDNTVMVEHGLYTGKIDKNWSINLVEKDGTVKDLIKKAELYKATATDFASYDKALNTVVGEPVIMPNAVYLKVTLKDSWKTVSTETLKYYVYVANNKTNEKTNQVWVSGKYAPDYRTVDFTWSNNANEAGLWKAEDNGVAVFDFADKAFFTVKMYKGETMYLDLETAYDKAIAGEMDVDADSFYKFDKTNANFSRAGELVIVTDDDTLVPYEIDEDGNFVELDAEYVKDYAIAHTNAKVNGFKFDTKQLGNYVLSTEELGAEEEVEEEEPEAEEEAPEVEEAPEAEEVPETNKPNPETGAEDFVGLAVSLAVVSVAAAGALALKK